MNFPVAELKERYGIGKQAEINRRKYLGIVPQKVGRVYVIDEDQLSLLDQLDEFLRSKPGVKMTDFDINSTGSTGSTESNESTGSNGSNESTGSNGSAESNGSTESNRTTVMDADLLDAGEATLVESSSDLAVADKEERTDLVHLVQEMARAITPPNPIAHWERLAWLAEQQIIITTSEVQALVGTRPKGKQWSRGSFSFTRSGKLGTQYGWIVARSSTLVEDLRSKK